MLETCLSGILRAVFVGSTAIGSDRIRNGIVSRGASGLSERWEVRDEAIKCGEGSHKAAAAVTLPSRIRSKDQTLSVYMPLSGERGARRRPLLYSFRREFDQNQTLVCVRVDGKEVARKNPAEG